MQLTVVTAADLEHVLALNEAAVPHVNSIDLEQMRWFAEWCPVSSLLYSSSRQNPLETEKQFMDLVYDERPWVWSV